MPSTSGGAEHRVAAEQERLGSRSSASPALRSPSARYASPITITREQLERRIAAVGHLARPLGGADQRAHVAGRSCAKTDASRYIAAARTRVGAADALGLGDQGSS